jgi:hypothetical protein
VRLQKQINLYLVMINGRTRYDNPLQTLWRAFENRRGSTMPGVPLRPCSNGYLLRVIGLGQDASDWPYSIYPEAVRAWLGWPHGLQHVPGMLSAWGYDMARLRLVCLIESYRRVFSRAMVLAGSRTRVCCRCNKPKRDDTRIIGIENISNHNTSKNVTSSDPPFATMGTTRPTPPLRRALRHHQMLLLQPGP